MFPTGNHDTAINTAIHLSLGRTSVTAKATPFAEYMFKAKPYAQSYVPPPPLTGYWARPTDLTPIIR
ncbi:hypothetical protein N7510_009690 [Penicillium lagena]|uniref:uncharacterized protein n=1 Tax=Penicillium lagena TaxID=94218 RepID=UPI0025411C68|nr:uncharacterized protein N7510_009690 [Penicillium lagena]KAJ5604536.1 hypothetical protein N7510_009690 [Penicillium lagena]